MRQNREFTSIGIFGICILMLVCHSTPSSAIDLDCRNFDDEIEGSFPTGFTVALKPETTDELADGGPGGIQQITSAEWQSSPGSLQLLADGTFNILYATFPRQSTGRIALSYSIRLDGEPHNSLAAVFLDDQSDGQTGPGSGRYSLAFTGDWNGRQIGWHDGSWHNLGGYLLDVWYDVTLDIDLDAKSFAIYVDGVLREAAAFPNQPGLIDGVQRLVVFHDNGTAHASSAWIDNLCLGSCVCQWPSDLDANGLIDAVDLAVEIDIVFFGTSDIQDPNCPTTRADFNNDGVTDAVDLAFLIDHVFFGGPGPVDPCAP